MSNVVRLPTAATKKVHQQFNRHLRDYRAANPWPGAYKRPIEREAFELAKSPELLVLMSVFKVLDEEQRAAAKKHVEGICFLAPGPEAYAALSIVSKLL